MGRMRVLIIHAHHEPSSFNGAMLRTAISALSETGHQVRVSDLYQMGFDPVSDRRNFIGARDSDRLDQQAEERFAAEHGLFAADIKAEMEKLAWCDVAIFQFPLWWLGMPAVMKGWIDRVFAVGVAYGGGRWFDRGLLAGKRAMLAVTTGGEAAAYSELGLYGPAQAILHPMNHGVLGFVGFEVIEPFVVYGPGRMEPGQRREALQRYRQRLVNLENAPLLPQTRSDDYRNFVRRPEGRPDPSCDN